MVSTAMAPAELVGGISCCNGGGLIDADSLILQSIASLCVKGFPEDKMPYFHEKVRPLVHSIVEHLMEHMPARPAVSLVIWLLGLERAPADLLSAVESWSQDGPFEAHPPQHTNHGRINSKTGRVSFNTGSKPQGKAASRMKSALKETAHITPNGTHLYDAEERARRVIPLTDQQRYEIIEDVNLFQGLDRRDLQAVAKACDLVKHLDGEEVLKIGSHGQGMHIVVEGKGKVLVSNEAGIVTPGDVFGDQCMLASIPSTEAVEAADGPLTTLHLPALTFKALGLKRKIGNMNRKKGLKARDHTMRSDARRLSCHGQEAVRAETEDELALVREAILRNDNIGEVLQLSDEQIAYVSREAYRQNFESNEVVFQKGSYGHRFYIVNEGVFEVSEASYKMGSEKRSQLKLRHGDSFGELALLYNAPRAACVRCTMAGWCWVISRTTFKNCMWMKMEGRIREYADLIREVDIFKDKVDEESLSTLCNALEERYFIQNEIIIEQGTPGDSFYVIFEGSCCVIKNGEELRELHRGDYFGERALIQQDVRTATVKVTSDSCTVLALDRVSFDIMIQQAFTKSTSMGISPKSSALDSLAGAIEDVESPGNDSSSSAGRRLATRLKSRFSVNVSDGDVDTPNSVLSPYKLKSSSHKNISRDSLTRVGVLGQGSFGYVTLEEDDKGTLYALKAMKKAHIEREQLREAVINEKTCMELLNSDWVVKLICTFRDRLHVYLLLEPCFGGELFDVFQENSDFLGSEAHALFYAACTALALEHIHDRRIIYRDLKLENCLLTLNGYLKLTDMGIAKVCIGKTYTVCGTTDYFAPETLRQNGHNRAVDWWALGVMIYIMMTGRSPFEAPDAMKTYRKIMKGFSKVSFPPDFPEQCVSMIKALCQRNPEERLTMGSLGVQNFKDHPWYRGFHWIVLINQKMAAPWVPAFSEEDIKANAKAKQEKYPDVGRDAGANDKDDVLSDIDGWDDIFDVSTSMKRGSDSPASPKSVRGEQVSDEA